MNEQTSLVAIVVIIYFHFIDCVCSNSIFVLFWCSDPVFIYTAAAAVARLRLKAWAEPFTGEWAMSNIPRCFHCSSCIQIVGHSFFHKSKYSDIHLLWPSSLSLPTFWNHVIAVHAGRCSGKRWIWPAKFHRLFCMMSWRFSIFVLLITSS